MFIIPAFLFLLMVIAGCIILFNDMAPVKSSNPSVKFSPTLEFIYKVGTKLQLK